MPAFFATADIFTQISLLIVLAALISGIVRLLKQPVIVGYILTGALVGTFLLNSSGERASFEVFSSMGISILLFIVGLNLSPRMVRDVGKSALLIGLGQMVLCVLMVMGLGKLLGFTLLDSLYISLAFSFSSTIIVLKLLSDKKDIEKLHGRLAVGILLVQDLVAILALILFAALSQTNGNASPLLTITLTVLRALFAFGILFLIAHFALPRLGTFFAKSQEYLFLFSIAWGFGLATLFKLIGLSYEIGALVAGVSLSVTPYAAEVGAKLKPLRDFFLILFFIMLGTRMSLTSLYSLGFGLLICVFFVVVIKPLCLVLLTSLSGYNTKTSFMVGISLGQLSEFSLVLAALGVSLGQLSHNALALVTGVAFLSIAVSTYSILHAEKIYPLCSKYLKVLARKRATSESSIVSSYDAVLFGCNRVGFDFIKAFQHLGSGFLCVDFDPDIIKKLKAEGINCVYGDAEDPEFLETVNIDKAKLVVSTIPEGEANEFLLTRIRRENKEAIVVLISYNVVEALRLYDKGATYVILPHFIGGEYAAGLTHAAGFDAARLTEKRTKHIAYLKERQSLGHMHP